MASPRPSTILLPCTYAASLATVRGHGWSGFHGPNTAITQASTSPCTPCRFRWSTVALYHPWCPKSLPRRARPWSTTCCWTTTPSSPTSAITYSRLSTMPSATTMLIIGPWSSTSMIGSSCVFSTNPPSH